VVRSLRLTSLVSSIVSHRRAIAAPSLWYSIPHTIRYLLTCNIHFQTSFKYPLFSPSLVIVKPLRMPQALLNQMWMRVYCSVPWVKKKQDNPTLAHNFAKYLPIFKILSPADSAVNKQWSGHERSHHASNASLHYLVKRKCQKTIDNLKEMSNRNV